MEALDLDEHIKRAVNCLHTGGVIAYPTEAVYGLGCDPFNIDAVTKILQIKKRSLRKGFLIVASSWEQVEFLTEPIPPFEFSQVMESWPGPTTWVFPSQPTAPQWLRGGHDGIAIRISAHPVVRALCDAFGGPIISTSANESGHTSLTDFRTVSMCFAGKIDYIVPGQTSGNKRPSAIRDAMTGDYIRR